jgi:hypothetical protein
MKWPSMAPMEAILRALFFRKINSLRRLSPWPKLGRRPTAQNNVLPGNFARNVANDQLRKAA